MMIEFRTSRPDLERAPSPRDAYEDIYRTEPIQQIDSFYLWALSLANVQPGQRLLDVSCGTGRLVHLGRELRAVGVDFSASAIYAARAQASNGAFLVGDAEALPFADGAFDRVINLGSLEHYDAPARAVREMARVLAPGGLAVILVPNTFSYLHVLYVWRHGRVFDDGQPLQRYGTHVEWRALLEANGLRVARTVKYQRVRPRFWRDAVWYLTRPTKLLQLLLTPFLPLHAASCFVFVCEPRSAHSGNLGPLEDTE